jgi:hypothetical protein
MPQILIKEDTSAWILICKQEVLNCLKTNAKGGQEGYIMYYRFPPGPNVRSYEAPTSAVSVKTAIQLILAIPLRPIHMAKCRQGIKACGSRPFQCTKRLSINSFDGLIPAAYRLIRLNLGSLTVETSSCTDAIPFLRAVCHGVVLVL